MSLPKKVTLSLNPTEFAIVLRHTMGAGYHVDIGRYIKELLQEKGENVFRLRQLEGSHEHTPRTVSHSGDEPRGRYFLSLSPELYNAVKSVASSIPLPLARYIRERALSGLATLNRGPSPSDQRTRRPRLRPAKTLADRAYLSALQSAHAAFCASYGRSDAYWDALHGQLAKLPASSFSRLGQPASSPLLHPSPPLLHNPSPSPVNPYPQPPASRLLASALGVPASRNGASACPEDGRGHSAEGRGGGHDNLFASLGLTDENIFAALEALQAAGCRYKDGSWDFREVRAPDLKRYREAYQALLPYFEASKPVLLPCQFTVRLGAGEEGEIRKMARERGVVPLVYCRIAALCKNPLKRKRGLATGKYTKVYLSPEDKESVSRSARRANMAMEHYLRCRLLNGFEPRDLFDKNGVFKLWRMKQNA